MKKKAEFDLDKTYTNIMSKERLIKIIKRTYDKGFKVTFLPTDKDKADILIQDLKTEEEK